MEPVPDTGDEPCLGYVFYAPPRSVPRAGRFPTGPVSADAVLLTSLGIDPGEAAQELSRTLIAAVVGDLVRRGVRALEAFGRTAEVAALSDPAQRPADVIPVMEALGDCSVEQCVLDSDLLLDAGANAKLQAAMGKLVQHGRVLSKANGVVKGQEEQRQQLHFAAVGCQTGHGG